MKAVTSDWRVWAIAIGAVVLLGTGLYFTGRWQERGQAEAAREEMEVRLQAVADERDRARAEITVLQARLHLVQARALLFEAALDLERRNFGIANQRLDAVAAQLEQVRGGSGIADTTALHALHREIAGLDLRVAENLAEPRGHLLDLASRLDSLVTSSQSERDDPR